MFENKIKKIWRGVIALVLILAFGLWGCSNSGSSKKERFPCFEYGGDETQVTGYKEKDNSGNACSLDVVIPEGVTHIAEDAFKDKGITSVTFPESVEDIGANAFAGNTFSSYVYIPNESATVNVNAFDVSVTVAKEGTDDCFIRDANDNTVLTAFPCSAETTIEIPSDIVSIEDGVFENKGLTSVTFFSGLESIGNNAFKDNDLESLNIPNTVTDIGNNAFEGNTNLAWVYIRNSSASVGADAFPNGHAVVVNFYCFQFSGNQISSYYDNNSETNQACSRDVEIPQGITSIKEYGFFNNSITSVTIPDTMTTIRERAFYLNSLESVIIPNSVTSIGVAAFANNSLTSVTLPENLTSIGDSVFANNSLTSVIIPESVTSIGEYAFEYSSLESVTIPENVTSIGESAFSNNSLTSVDIPDGVTTIEEYTFAGNALVSVTIGSGVTTIEVDAFTDNDDLTDVCIEANSADVTVETGAFPAGVTPTYESDGDCSN